jgi:hypothetical protein
VSEYLLSTVRSDRIATAQDIDVARAPADRLEFTVWFQQPNHLIQAADFPLLY